MDFGIKGKYALVTAGSRGIGRAIALALAKEGCHVAVCARTAESLADTCRHIQSLGVNAKGIQADAADPAEAALVMSEVLDEWGTLHILVNNLGGGGRWGKTFPDTDDKTWMEVYEKNAMAAVRFTRLAMPSMLKQSWGRVVTITSIYGREAGEPGEVRPWYAMAKSAETALMKTLASDPAYARKNITFNSVAPGFIAPREEGDKKSEKSAVDLLRNSPLGRFGTPEEVGAVVAFLCSEQASSINGVSLPVDGALGRSFI